MSGHRWSWIERRQRRAARLALYGSLLLVGLLFVAARPVLRSWSGGEFAQSWTRVRWAEKSEVRLLQEYVRIDTTWDQGNEVAGARFLEAELARAGIPSRLEVLGDRHANLWAVLEGEDPQALVLHSHIDTDPLFQPERWKHQPLAATIDPPWIYGRGVFDMKSVTIAQLLAFIRLNESGVPLRRSVVFLATGSEEVGSDLGARWVLANHPELVRRFWAVLTEGGGVEALTTREVKYWGTEAGQRHYLDYRFCSPSLARLEALRDDLRAHGRTLTHLRLTPEVEALLAGYVRTRTRRDLQVALGDYHSLPSDPARFARLPRFVQSMFRDEVSVGEVEEAPDGSGYRLRAILQLLPGTDVAAAQRRLVPEWMTLGVDVRVTGGPVAVGGSSVVHPLFQTIEAVLADRHPGVAAGPYFLVYSATDARFFRAAGIPSYGFSPFLIVSTDTLQVGRANERMALPAYVDGVALYADLVERLVR